MAFRLLELCSYLLGDSCGSISLVCWRILAKAFRGFVWAFCDGQVALGAGLGLLWEAGLVGVGLSGIVECLFVGV